MKKFLNILWTIIKFVLAMVLLVVLFVMGLSAILAGLVEKIFRAYKRFIVGILIVFRDEVLGKKAEEKPTGTINEKVDTKETIIAVLKNVKTGEKRVIRERWYHRILKILRRLR